MVRIRTEDRCSFVAHDETGDEYVIDVTVDVLRSPAPGNPDWEEDGIATFRTRNGYPVEEVKARPGWYRISLKVGSFDVYSDDPNQMLFDSEWKFASGGNSAGEK